MNSRAKDNCLSHLKENPSRKRTQFFLISKKIRWNGIYPKVETIAKKAEAFELGPIYHVNKPFGRLLAAFRAAAAARKIR